MLYYLYMGYVGSHVWTIRQKIGHDELIVATVDAVAIRDDKVCLVYNNNFSCWTLPSGHVEINDSWQSAIKTELLEEAGIVAQEKDLIPFASVSGPNNKLHYPNGDNTRPFTLVFVCEHFDETELTDTEEISEKRWVKLKDIDRAPLGENAARIIEAYKKYRETGIFQQIIV